MPKKIRICALCGNTNVIGGYDHLPPKAIFQKPRPLNLITVPSCNKCNNNGSKDDEDFETFLAFIIGFSPERCLLYSKRSLRHLSLCLIIQRNDVNRCFYLCSMALIFKYQ